MNFLWHAKRGGVREISMAAIPETHSWFTFTLRVQGHFQVGKLADILHFACAGSTTKTRPGSCNAFSTVYRHDITSISYTKQQSQERLQHHHNVLSRVSVSLSVVQAKDSFSLRQS